MTKVLGLITARGGSKGIPKKNIVNVGGKPLIAWTIEAALKSHVFDRVVVSTDNNEIASIAQKWGAEVPFTRPDRLAKDDSPHTDVLIHAINWLQEKEDYLPEFLMLLQPTSPLRTSALQAAGSLTYISSSGKTSALMNAAVKSKPVIC